VNSKGATDSLVRFLRRTGYRVPGARDFSVAASVPRACAGLHRGELDLVKDHGGMWIWHRLVLAGGRLAASYWWTAAATSPAAFHLQSREGRFGGKQLAALTDTRLALSHRWVRIYADAWGPIDRVLAAPGMDDALRRLEFVDLVVRDRAVFFADADARCLRLRLPQADPPLAMQLAAYPGADAQVSDLLGRVVSALPDCVDRPSISQSAAGAPHRARARTV
jgi:hypothetical protein